MAADAGHARDGARKARVLLAAFSIVSIIVGLAAWWKQDWLRAEETALKPINPFQECTDCPEMIIVPTGNFRMGSPETEKDRSADEGPQHKVAIAKPFAVSKFELTFAQWDACVVHGNCVPHVSDGGWGRDQQPAINVSWDDAQR
jgi:formylglycine-generating enzyme required for sulfatase activity